MSSVEVTVTLYLGDEGWTVNGEAPGVHTSIPPGIYKFSHVFVTPEGEVGFNYELDEIQPEFTGKDLALLSKKGCLIFQKTR